MATLVTDLITDLKKPGRVRKLGVYVVTIVGALLSAHLVPGDWQHVAETLVALAGGLGIYKAKNDKPEDDIAAAADTPADATVAESGGTYAVVDPATLPDGDQLDSVAEDATP